MRNKRGTTTLFLAIILSSLILIETTYIAYVADLDRRLTLTRALKSQGEVYLAQYDRVLFKTYGIYAFDSNQLNDYVFNDVLSANGYEVGETLYVSGIYQFNTEDLRRVVASYYTYRTSGIIFEKVSAQLFEVLESIDEYGVIEYIREFTSSSASNIIERIIDGGLTVAQDIIETLEELDIGVDSDSFQFFINLISSLGQLRSNSVDTNNGFNPANMGFISTSIQSVIDMYESTGDLIADYMLHPYLVDYAAYNFDTRLVNDTTINGYDFSTFHQENTSDSEYILTGFEGTTANLFSYYAVYSFLLVENIAFILIDSSNSELITSCGEILSVFVTAISGGTVPLPPIVYEIVVILIWASVKAYTDSLTLLSGESVNFLEINGIEALSLNYRDCLSTLLFYIPDELLLERITNIINRDFGDYITGVDIESNYGMRTLHYEAVYDLYV
ncbi:MAG: hypothetical protein MJ094_02130 [Saccharofermentans sp.]|nr:hypothetical protein [Saccharofermentans sp.]